MRTVVGPFVAARRVRPAGASGTEWTLWTPGPCLGGARSLSLGVGLGRLGTQRSGGVTWGVDV